MYHKKYYVKKIFKKKYIKIVYFFNGIYFRNCKMSNYIETVLQRLLVPDSGTIKQVSLYIRLHYYYYYC